MAEILVTSAALRSRAEELNQLNSRFKNAVDSLREEENVLRSQYEGESSDAFHAAFSRDTVQMDNFYNAIARYVQNLLSIAEKYERAEQEAAAIAGGGSGGGGGKTFLSAPENIFGKINLPNQQLIGPDGVWRPDLSVMLGEHDREYYQQMKQQTLEKGLDKIKNML